MATKKQIQTGAVAGAAAALAAAGAYWFYGAKDAAKHRRQAKSFMLKARVDVVDAVEAAIKKVGDIDKEAYLQIVDTVLKRYSGVAGITKQELGQMARDLKSAWAHMQSARRTVKPVAKRVAKKAAKKKK